MKSNSLAGRPARRRRGRGSLRGAAWAASAALSAVALIALGAAAVAPAMLITAAWRGCSLAARQNWA